MVCKVTLLPTPTVSQLKAQRRNDILLLITVCVLLPVDLLPSFQRKKKHMRFKEFAAVSR